MPPAVIEHLRQVAEEGRRSAPPGLEEHYARRAVMREYMDMLEVQNDIDRLGLVAARD